MFNVIITFLALYKYGLSVYTTFFCCLFELVHFLFQETIVRLNNYAIYTSYVRLMQYLFFYLMRYINKQTEIELANGRISCRLQEHIAGKDYIVRTAPITDDCGKWVSQKMTLEVEVVLFLLQRKVNSTDESSIIQLKKGLHSKVYLAPAATQQYGIDYTIVFFCSSSQFLVRSIVIACELA